MFPTDAVRVLVSRTVSTNSVVFVYSVPLLRAASNVTRKSNVEATKRKNKGELRESSFLSYSSDNDTRNDDK